MTKYHKLLTTEGVWYDLIKSGKKTFDFRKGIRKINTGDIVIFMEATPTGFCTGSRCDFKVILVIYSTDFPEHFNWEGGEFTIIQFEELDINGE